MIVDSLVRLGVAGVGAGSMLAVGVGTVHVNTLKLVQQRTELSFGLKLLEVLLDCMILRHGILFIDLLWHTENVIWVKNVLRHELLESRAIWRRAQVAAHHKRYHLFIHLGDLLRRLLATL